MSLEKTLDLFRQIAESTVREEAPLVDKEAKWPEQSMRRLQREGLGGFVVPQESGGLGEGLLGLAQACELLGEESASAGLCFGMHCVGTAMIAAKATDYQKKNFLEPIAAGEHLTTLALSEPGTGAHFYYPQTQLLSVSESEFMLKGEKTFVTNGGKADSYVISTMGVDPEALLHEFSCVVVEADREGIQWGADWNGIGMRGNSSRSLALQQVKVPAQNLLGQQGDQLWYVFQVVAPYFLTAMSGTYLGVAQAAFNEAREHLMNRSYRHSGMSLSQNQLLQHRLGMLWAKVERTRQLIYNACRQYDSGDPMAVLSIISSKAEVAHCAVDVVNEAMTLSGGIAYRENSRFEVLLRDARAAHVMAPTTDMLYTWLGRALLEQLILDS
ncbi:acyl-CoA dehydrogenase family protein [Pontibacter anaerobius]|uniref:Acyl-CoA/acyl-ACP dehydrogenase n=1 Tax=Pontibacter anaerobius TaxID=2993940 RepID=A0ABT3RFR0_9BACT|nr:acyl-CoA dehydrogenase family protein [Pontibacter anaerobius]MCX2740313.1 acyl-CoA/acyl-ACP dehydrogenase [Pontibacter anaerobius]